MTALIDQSGKSFEELLTVSDLFRDKIAAAIADAEADIDAAKPNADDDRRRLRDIASSLDEVSTVKLVALALLNDENGGVTLMQIANMLADIGIFQISDGTELVAAFDDDVAALDRKLWH